ncbi:endolytic transglycosylase MltG [Candidatus Kaiserbacteria bacterium]|nr:endolytic transglycosylase MltG [Candidatus Kaiserbacteria bacterium]
MLFSHHFPTFTPVINRVAAWYKERDLLERFGINFIAWGGIVYFIFLWIFAAPVGFPTGAYIKVEEGMSLKEIATTFESRGVVDNALLFEFMTWLLGDDRHLPAGQYFFSRQENMIWVAERLLAGDFETTAMRVTIPEGSTAEHIGKLILDKVPDFSYRQFVERAREGYLFPDTYFFRPGQSTEAILSVFENNFKVKMLKAAEAIQKSGHTQDEILAMASILEKEASKTADRKQIAGVLWHRIDIGMPLQVDAVFPYIIGKNTFELTHEDLKIDNPYNLYLYKGLPPGPINNPGLDAILAAAQPVKSKYIFFLSDRNGNFHYAVTYAQHMANKAKYLD